MFLTVKIHTVILQDMTMCGLVSGNQNFNFTLQLQATEYFFKTLVPFTQIQSDETQQNHSNILNHSTYIQHHHDSQLQHCCISGSCTWTYDHRYAYTTS